MSLAIREFDQRVYERADHTLLQVARYFKPL
jgi:hypothetical protein